MREKIVEKYLVDKIKALGGVAWKWSADKSRRGVPDRVVIFPNGGRVVFVEVKSPTGRLSKIQEATIKLMKTLGATVVVVWSKDDVDSLVDEYAN